ncbi:YraN family protein [Desertihabitans aurantiacus]|uniref:YraN family protein n=1 Tax=Desertihabitans aurantiacus TaxID=2282477 RepID=UPI000DF82ABA|nr:YraN family protein [Desertihabitans aurantiacus]
MGTRQALGRLGETLAAGLLEEQGCEVLERNWRCSEGEIDIVAREPSTATYVFCEVKCRRGLGWGDPLEAITWAKLRKLRQLAAIWSSRADPRPERIRIDAVGVVLRPGEMPLLSHVRGVG